MGPFPEEVGFGGPVYDELSKLWKVLLGGTEVAQAQLVAPPEERKKVMERFKQNWGTLMQGSGQTISPLGFIPDLDDILLYKMMPTKGVVKPPIPPV